MPNNNAYQWLEIFLFNINGSSSSTPVKVLKLTPYTETLMSAGVSSSEIAYNNLHYYLGGKINDKIWLGKINY